MGKITVETCPETGICSLVKDGNLKVDLLPTECEQLKMVAGDVTKAKAIIEQSDSLFAESLTTEELNDILRRLG